jgi:hypothetical protein
VLHNVIEELEQIDVIVAQLRQGFEWRTSLSVEFGQLVDELFVLGSPINRMDGWLRRHDAASLAAGSGYVKI